VINNLTRGERKRFSYLEMKLKTPALRLSKELRERFLRNARERREILAQLISFYRVPINKKWGNHLTEVLTLDLKSFPKKRTAADLAKKMKVSTRTIERTRATIRRNRGKILNPIFISLYSEIIKDQMTYDDFCRIFGIGDPL